MTEPLELNSGPQPEVEHIVPVLVDFAVLPPPTLLRLMSSSGLPILAAKIASHSRLRPPRTESRGWPGTSSYSCSFGMRFDERYDYTGAADNYREGFTGDRGDASPPFSYQRPEGAPSFEELRERLLRRLINDSLDL